MEPARDALVAPDARGLLSCGPLASVLVRLRVHVEAMTTPRLALLDGPATALQALAAIACGIASGLLVRDLGAHLAAPFRISISAYAA
jgi:hypothetical protein